MIFKKAALISFWCWSNAIMSNYSFSWLVCSFFDDWLFYYFRLYYLQKQLSPCHCKMQLFALYSNHYIATTKTKIRYKSFKFDVNLVSESEKFNSIRWFFVIWIENINAVVRTNLIPFNKMRYNFDLWIAPKFGELD